ncbi:hypothetical protein, partial [Phaeovulum sp.]|uniref:hypothetical protein n=1 Tax=Phaeovulum sp. TaxID=2934796 RepID=UPI00356986D6
MIAALRLWLFVLLFAVPASAETVPVLSGEHESFSRLVLRLSEPSGWLLGKADGGYELRLSRPEITLDLARVFQFIPRTRITALTAAESGLSLSVARGTHATAFEAQPGTIVIDVANGPAPAGSPFEASLVPDVPAGAATTLPTLDALTLPMRPAIVPPDPRLAYAWPNLTAPAQAPSASPAAHDPRVAEAEQQLMLQLGRAASQGLVTMTLPDSPNPPAALPPLSPQPPAEPDLATQATHQLAVRSQTVFDRDGPKGRPREALNPDGLACIADEFVNVSDWSNGDPVALQIGTAQTGLLGEFDRPDSDRVLALARLYIALGMGAEVPALLQSLGTEVSHAELLRAMAAIIDDAPVPTAARLAEMTACESQIALWAVLASSSLEHGDAVNTVAVLRAFSNLPLNLRHLLGPRLADRLLDIGAEAAARGLRSAITRAPGDHGTAVGLIDAGIELSAGAPAAAAAALMPIMAENGPDAPLATIRFIDAQLAAGEAVQQPTIDAVAALAFEHREAALGPELARAHMLAAGSAGLFEQAFAALANMPEQASDAFVAARTAELMHQLAATPDDLVFATQYFANRTLVLLQRDWALQMQTAARLIDLGFPAEARRVLGAEAVRTDEGRLLRAQASLLEADGAAALAEISGLDGAEATRLRAEALRLTGDHDAARRAFERVDDPANAAEEAWAAGAWAEAAVLGTDAQRALLAAFGLGTPTPDAAPAPPDEAP